MTVPAPDAGQLIEQAKAGSESSLGRLLDSYREYLLRIANDRIDSGLRPKLPASDIVQGSMMIATSEFSRFRGQTEPEFRNWILRIMVNHLVDGLRRFSVAEKRRTDRETVQTGSKLRKLQGSEATPSRLASMKEEAEQLLSSMNALPEPLRVVVLGRYLERLTFAELAERLDLPVTTCRRRWLQAVELMTRGESNDRD